MEENLKKMRQAKLLLWIFLIIIYGGNIILFFSPNIARFLATGDSVECPPFYCDFHAFAVGAGLYTTYIDIIAILVIVAVFYIGTRYYKTGGKLKKMSSYAYMEICRAINISALVSFLVFLYFLIDMIVFRFNSTEVYTKYTSAYLFGAVGLFFFSFFARLYITLYKPK